LYSQNNGRYIIQEKYISLNLLRLMTIDKQLITDLIDEQSSTCNINRPPGNLLRIDASSQRHGTLIHVNANSMSDGEIVYIKSNNLQREGKAIHLESTSSLSNHVVKLDAYETRFGNVVAVNGKNMENGSLVHITSTDGDALIGSPTSFKIVDIPRSGAPTVIELENYHNVFATGDKVRIMGIGGDNDVTSMHQLNNNIYTITQHAGDNTKIKLDGVDSSQFTEYDKSISSRGIVTRVGGKLLHIQGDSQTDGTLVDISGRKLVNGTALKITGGAHMDRGSLIDLQTTSAHLDNGALQLVADSVQTGKIVTISGDSLTSGYLIDIDSTTDKLNSNGKIINILASKAKYGTMIDVKTPEMIDGKLIHLQASKL